MTLTGFFVPEAKPPAIVDLQQGDRACREQSTRAAAAGVAEQRPCALSGGVRREAEEEDPRTGRRRRKGKHQAE